ncbi:predicted protein [Naegleria gruberi]|uniref:Predicted protein n=1 Tax=Naegleria gruberi TaxID=5762 RepID=D2VQQ1_NAEGR|nr:uncharacterized protein NAEGRDRAFT_80894 [Naegleria gruberi]EFC40986.1 predicted protein [Naegleria gruberi]|eukprot:XP_002673730.1 predicted protein [Naegleria gruberi strain NEG-M]
MQFWVQDVQPKWLPEGFQVPTEMLNQVQQLCKQAETAYNQVDLERNGFLRRREFKKAMKRLGINKFEARHMLSFVDRERLKVVSIKNYVNAYLFIKSGGLNHINADYQGPLTSSVDQRTHMNNTDPGEPFNFAQLAKRHLSNTTQPLSFIAQNIFQPIPRPKYVVGYTQSMKAANGMYLCSENGRVVADRPVVGPWENFYLMSDTDWTDWVSICALRTWWHTYLCCDNDNSIVDNRIAIGGWEKFTVEVHSSGTSFRAWTGGYLTADAAGNVSFNATSIGPNEIWTCKVLSSVYL